MSDATRVDMRKVLFVALALLVGAAIAGSLLYVAGKMLLVMAASACEIDPGLSVALTIWLGVYLVSIVFPLVAYLFRKSRKAGLYGSLVALAFMLLAFAAIFFSFLSVCQDQIVS